MIGAPRSILRFAVLGVLLTPDLAAADTPAEMEPLTWLEIENTQMISVAPQSPDEFPGTWGVVGPAGVVSAWNSATLDVNRSRMILHGGGHNDYYGNEIYLFDIATLSWERLTDPTVNPPGGSDIYPDDTPQSRHTYNGTAYIDHLDRFFVFAGSGSTIDGNFPPTENVWTYDFTASQWSYVNTPPPEGPPHGEGSSSIYDPETGLVWWGDGRNSNPGDGWGLWSWDPDNEQWAHHTFESVFSGATGCLDSERGQLVFVGDGAVYAFDVRSGSPQTVEWDTTGATAILGETAPGVAYDPMLDRIVAWQGGPVYVLDPETRVWEAIDADGAPSPDASRGTYGRFAYVPSVNAFISINDAEDNVYFFKHGPGEGMPPPGTGESSSGDGGSDDSGVDDTGGGEATATGGVSGSVGDATGSAGSGGAQGADGGDDSSSDGCSCRSRGGVGGWWLAVLLLGLTAARARERC